MRQIFTDGTVRSMAPTPGGKKGRPKKPASEKRRPRTMLRLFDSEYDLLTRAAASESRRMADWARAILVAAARKQLGE